MKSTTTKVLFGIYCAIVLVAVVLHLVLKAPASSDGKSAKQVTTAAELPPNYYLRDGDLMGDGDKSDVSGKYTNKRIKNGAPITPDDVEGTAPTADTYDGVLSLGFSPKIADQRLGNAEQTVAICRNEEKLGEATVVVQLCPTGAEASGCHLLVRPNDPALSVNLKGLRAAVSSCRLTPAVGPDSAK